MKLWIDDKREAPQGWTAVKSSRDALRLVQTGIVDEVSFDHDLGGEDTAYKVATYIEEMAFMGMIPRLKWQIHSQNPVGRDRILAALERAEVFWGHEKIVAS